MRAKPEELPIKRGGGERYRYTMPKPILSSINKGKWTSLVNSKSLSSALLQEECFISQWLSYSLEIQTKIRPGQIVMNKPIDENTFLNALYDMIENFVACPACGSPETTFEHRNDGVALHCSTCGFMNAIRPSKSEAVAKMTNYIKTQGFIEPSFDDSLGELPCRPSIDINELEKLSTQIKKDEEDKKRLNQLEKKNIVKRLMDMIDNKESDRAIYNEFICYTRGYDVKNSEKIKIIFEALFSRNKEQFIQIIKERNKLLILLTHTEDEQLSLLGRVTKFTCVENPNFFSSIPVIYQTLYQYEIIEESVFTLWQSRRLSSEETLKKKGYAGIVDAVDPFYNWLRSAKFED